MNSYDLINLPSEHTKCRGNDMRPIVRHEVNSRHDRLIASCASRAGPAWAEFYRTRGSRRVGDDRGPRSSGGNDEPGYWWRVISEVRWRGRRVR